MRRHHPVSHRVLLSCSICALLALVSTGANAATRTWTGNASSSWIVATNWTSNILPANGDDVVFNAAGFRQTVDLGGLNRTVASLAFSGDKAYTIQPGGLSTNLLLGTGNLTSDGLATHTINAPVVLGAAGTWDISGSNPLVVSGGVTDGAKDFGLQKTGSGSLTLTNSNASLFALRLSAGTTTLSGGSMALRATTGIPLFMNAGVLRLQGGATLTGMPGGAMGIGIDTAQSRSQVIVSNPGSKLTGQLIYIGVNSGDRGELIVEDSGGADATSSFIIGQAANTEGTLVVRTNAVATAPTVHFGGLNAASNNAKSTLRVESGGSFTTGSMIVRTDNGSVVVNGGTLEVNDWTEQFGFRSIVSLLANPANGMALRINTQASPSISSVIQGNGGIEKLGTGTLTLSNTGNSFNSIRISEGTLQMATNSFGAANSPILLNGGKLYIAGNIQSAHPLVLEKTSTLEVAPATTFTSTAGIQGNSSLTKVGPGTFTLGGNVSINGILTIAGGTLSLLSPEMFAPQASLEVMTGTAVNLNGNSQTFPQFPGTGAINLGSVAETKMTVRVNSNQTFSGTISGMGTVVKEGSATLTVTGISTASRGIVVREGTLAYSSGTLGGGSVQLDGGRFLALNSFAATQDLQLVSEGVVEAGAGITTTWPSITGSGNLTVAGNGTLRVNGRSEYSGKITVSGGTLQFDALQGTGVDYPEVKLVNSGKLLLNTGQTLSSLEGDSTTSIALSDGLGLFLDKTSTFAGSITGTGSINKLGLGTLVLTGQSTYNGTFNLYGGMLVLMGGPDRLPSTTSFVLSEEATLYLRGASQTFSALSGGPYNRSFITLNGGTLTLNQDTNTTFTGSIVGTGEVVKSGGGTLNLGGFNSFSGSVTVSDGHLVMPFGLGGEGGTLRVEASGEFAAAGIVFRETHAAGAGTIRATGDLQIGVSGSTIGYRHGGTLDVGTRRVLLLDADKAQLGIQTMLAEGGKLSSLNGIELPKGGKLTASGNAVVEDSLTNLGTIEGPSATATWLTLTGAITGNGAYSGNVKMLGSFSPGDGASETTINGNLTVGPQHLLSLQLGGRQLGMGYDHLDITGNFTAGGILSLSLLNGFFPVPGDIFDLFDYGTLTGTFSQLILPELTPGLSWDSSDLYDTGILMVVPEPSAALLSSLGGAAWGLLGRRRREQREA